MYVGRKEGMDAEQGAVCRGNGREDFWRTSTSSRTFSVGLSAAGVLKPDMVVKQMGRDPLIFAMAAESRLRKVCPKMRLAVRPDAIIGTRTTSDYPNQINNVLCFPFIFRGALDCGATTINEAMKLATVHALEELAHAEIPEAVASAYKGAGLRFGREYLIPKPFDPRLIRDRGPAVAKAAAESGVASRPIVDMEAYRQKLSRFVYHSGRRNAAGVFAACPNLAEISHLRGREDERGVLRAAQVVVDGNTLAKPLLLGRSAEIEARIKQFGATVLSPGATCDIVDPQDTESPERAAASYRGRKKALTGVSEALARAEWRSNRARCLRPPCLRQA